MVDRQRGSSHALGNASGLPRGLPTGRGPCRHIRRRLFLTGAEVLHHSLSAFVGGGKRKVSSIGKRDLRIVRGEFGTGRAKY